MEDFVPFKLAQKLKEKGLILKKTEIYGKFDNDGLFHSQLYSNYIETMDCDEIITPTISQVLKWLREEKGIHVCIALGEFSDWMYDVSRIDGNMFCKAEDDFKSYEQAALAGIEYVLDNLI